MRKPEKADEDKKLTAEIRVYCDPRLKEAAGKAADEARLPLNEYVARVLAEHLGTPQLGSIPRKSFGRPRKSTEARAS
ncbi:MAG: hypothetical protein KGL39_59710 [Patescibacteria group bacterium]|nr:hypothetical protein [Patescibacteria group bacterium]